MVSKLTITALYSAVKECRLKPVEDSIQQHGIPKSTKKTTDYLVLQTALDKNHKHIAKLLINAGCRINPNENEKNNGWTPLAWAIIRGNVEIAMLLLNKGATSEAGNKSGLTVLHLAVRKKSLTMIRVVICFMSINLVDSKSKTVLQTFFQVVCNQINGDQASMTNNAEILDFLLKKGASLRFQNDPCGFTPMHYAVKSKQVGLINRMIQATGNVNVQSNNGETPLHVLLSEKNNYRRVTLDIVRLLVRNRANVNIANNQSETLLHVILSRCNGNEAEVFEIIQFLVEQGANINAQNHRSESPCHLAAKKKCFRILQLFLQNQCQINLVDYDNNTILHRLLQNSGRYRTNDDFIEIVNQVVALGPLLEVRNAEGKTPLDLTIQNMHSRLLEHTLTEDFNINVVDENGNTMLHIFLIDLLAKNLTIDDSHIELIEILLSNGANVDLANNDNKTPIQLIFDMEKKECNSRMNIHNVLLHLLNYTTNLKITDKNGKPILHIMSSLKRPFTESEDMKAAEIVDVYLTKGAEVDLKDSVELTALCMAATNRQQHVVQVLLKHSADPNAYIPSSQATILECLLRMKEHSVEDVEIAGSLLSYGAEIDGSPGSEFSILHYVTLPNKFDMCSKLIAHSDSVNMFDDQDNTPLHNLLRYQQDIDHITESKVCKVATELMLKGDLINSKNNQGLTPLHLAVKQKLYEVAKDLLKRHANPVARDNAGNYALHFLGSEKFKSNLDFAKRMVKLLIGAGCDVNTSNNDGTTPLLAAVNAGCFSSVQVLIRFKADVNLSTNEDLLTPLHSAAYHNQTKIAEFLIKYGADINAKRSDGKTALHIAVLYDANEIVESLLKNGADPDMKDVGGKTAIFMTCSFYKFEAMRKLMNYGADIKLRDNSGTDPRNLVHDAVRKEISDHLNKINIARVFTSQNYLENEGVSLIPNDDRCKELEKEVEKLKEVKISNQKSLADVLKMNPSRLASSKNNEEFQKLINSDDFEEQFPNYAKLLKACYTRGLIRSDMLAQAKISFRELLEVPLPDICCDVIFSFLSNDSLQELVTATRLKSKTQKRQRDADDDGDITSPAKRVRRLSV